MTESSWHGGKGDSRRKSNNTDYIDSLRWELWLSTTPLERKEEIKKELKSLTKEAGHE